jgi:hypothetical protein
LSSYEEKLLNSHHAILTTNHNTIVSHKHINESNFSCCFLPCDNGLNYELHPFGYGNSLVLNQEDRGVGMLLHLRMTALHKLACYTMNDNGADDCRVCFVVQNVAAGDNTGRLDVAIVCNSTVFTPDHEHRSMQRLYHHNHGYA